jgi:hypothetical protein
MNPQLEDLDLLNMLYRVDPKGFALRPPVGAALFVARGEIWLTQEGLREDLILHAGERFDVRGPGKVVLSATQGAADVYLARPLDARAEHTQDLTDFLRATAARLRNEELTRVAQALQRGGVQLRRWIVQGLRALRPRLLGSGGRRGEREWRRIEHLGPSDREASLLSAARLFH